MSCNQLFCSYVVLAYHTLKARSCSSSFLRAIRSASAGCTEEQLKDQAEGIVRQSFRSAQANAGDAAIVSASPHCGPGGGVGILPPRTLFRPREMAESSASSSHSEEETSESEDKHPSPLPAPRPMPSLDIPAARSIAPLSDVELSDPLSLAARELLLLREASQVDPLM